MTRGVALYFVGSVALVALAGCGRNWEEREPWRHEAEVACLKSGAIKEGPAIVAIKPIEGPGICGADFPLKVTALGESPLLGYADDLRPPGTIPQYYPPVQQTTLPPVSGPVSASPPVYPSGPYSAPVASAPGAPLSIAPPDDEDPPSVGGVPAEAPSGATPITVGSAAIVPTATLACPIVSALDNWVTNAVQPAAQRWFGAPVVEIKQISAYSCRSMNGQRGAPISEHAFGNALDVAGFTLADGRKVMVKDGWHGLPEERGFLHDVQAAACQQFSTVLAPGSNVFHYDHIHVDLARHASGKTYCKPAAIPGDIAAGQPGRFAARTGEFSAAR